MDEFITEPPLDEADEIYETLRPIVEMHGMQMSDIISVADLKTAVSGGLNKEIVLESIARRRQLNLDEFIERGKADSSSTNESAD